MPQLLAKDEEERFEHSFEARCSKEYIIHAALSSAGTILA
jgi:hypothetical protein